VLQEKYTSWRIKNPPKKEKDLFKQEEEEMKRKEQRDSVDGIYPEQLPLLVESE